VEQVDLAPAAIALQQFGGLDPIDHQIWREIEEHSQDLLADDRKALDSHDPPPDTTVGTLPGG
jgi:hypothetical protein